MVWACFGRPVHIIKVMGITVKDPTQLNVFERTSNGNLILEFVNTDNKHFVRFEARLSGVKEIAGILNTWIDEKEQSNRSEEDRDSS